MTKMTAKKKNEKSLKKVALLFVDRNAAVVNLHWI